MENESYLTSPGLKGFLNLYVIFLSCEQSLIIINAKIIIMFSVTSDTRHKIVFPGVVISM